MDTNKHTCPIQTKNRHEVLHPAVWELLPTSTLQWHNKMDLCQMSTRTQESNTNRFAGNLASVKLTTYTVHHLVKIYPKEKWVIYFSHNAEYNKFSFALLSETHFAK